jgi:hypothetical protein
MTAVGGHDTGTPTRDALDSAAGRGAQLADGIHVDDLASRPSTPAPHARWRPDDEVSALRSSRDRETAEHRVRMGADMPVPATPGVPE